MARLANMLFVAGFLAAGCDLDGQVVGPRGGTVVSEDGRFSIEIAPGALEREVEITISAVGCGAMAAVAMAPCYDVGPRGTSFLFPAKITFELEDAQLERVGADRLALSGRRDLDWSLLADRTIDVEDGTLSASAAYLSSFALVAVGEEKHDAAREPAGE